MPSAPRKPCRKPGCNILGTTAYCETHAKKKQTLAKKNQREYDKLRGNRHERGYTNKWVKASANFRRGKVCVNCEKKGISKMSECTDHIIPHKGDMALFWDIANWQPLCIACNSEKAATEEGGYGNTVR